MIKTVIGSFDSFDLASQVAADLVAAGFLQSDIHVLGTYPSREIDERGTSGNDDDTHDVTSNVGAAGRGLIGRLTAMGIPGSDAPHYAESIRRGGAVITVKVDICREDEAKHLMRRHGPIDIEDRVEQWKGTGWSGYDASAAPFSFDQIEQERQRFAGRSQQQRTMPPF